MKRLPYSNGSTIVSEGTMMNSLIIVRSGVVVMEQTDRARSVELGHLPAGDMIGECRVLTGAVEIAHSRSLTSVVVYEVPKEDLAVIMRQKPALAFCLQSGWRRSLDSGKNWNRGRIGIQLQSRQGFGTCSNTAPTLLDMAKLATSIPRYRTAIP
ncbi:cyclic nucleotide-binding domain-containing protein [Rhizobium sp. BK418]|uniref:cyclic nucleotide-binding domain-containing protein n=1 Tax=Rhizobium sp. BK418 TaxID=2512120 RepID=UPI001049BCA1|nr:cyclic nucleotide-binding domain-containing protein [Rhizobium sp. BK418]